MKPDDIPAAPFDWRSFSTADKTVVHSVEVGIRHPALSSIVQGSLTATQSEVSLILLIQVVLGMRIVVY